MYYLAKKTYINKDIHDLLMHGYATLNMLVRQSLKMKPLFPPRPYSTKLVMRCSCFLTLLHHVFVLLSNINELNSHACSHYCDFLFAFLDEETLLKRVCLLRCTFSCFLPFIGVGRFRILAGPWFRILGGGAGT